VGGFSEVLSKEVRPLGINVTIVEPGGLRTDWAGSSMQVPPISGPYRQSVGVFAELVRGMDGKQNGDPQKAAELIVGLPELADPPLHLLLGSDAYRLVTEADRQKAAADEKWRSLSESIDFEGGVRVPQL
jgi:NAD(P)-dependent dehydrogenase (short-subunit alcohol dehydrogenase family)